MGHATAIPEGAAQRGRLKGMIVPSSTGLLPILLSGGIGIIIMSRNA